MKPTGNIVQLGVAGSIVQLGVTGNISQGGTLPWNKFWYILKSGDIWYRREMNYDGGYFVLSYSDDAGVTWENLLVLDINESSVIIDRAHVYSHRIIGTAYYVDNLLTSLGYSGVEGTDWENLYNNFDWNAYWAALISATVEDASPTHVVLTFPSAADLGATDFTIAGFTIDSASWAGAVLTLVLSETVVYGDTLTVTFVETGGTAAVTNNVAMVAEYQTLYDSLTTKPSAAIAARQNTFVSGRVASGVWAKLDCFWGFAQTINGDGEALKNWVNPGTYDATIVNAPTFTALEGFLTNGTTSFINTNFDTSGVCKYVRDSASFGIYSRTDSNPGVIAFDMGIRGVTTRSLLASAFKDRMFVRLNSAAASSLANATTLGMFIAVRENANSQKGYKNKTKLIDAVVASSGLDTRNFYIGGYDTNNGLTGPVARQYSCGFIGGTLTQADVNDITDAWEAYMDSNGKGVIP